ncbi:MAG TPA: response regulator transcription factor, partial [Steroidobacteraceae bacterium]|nr:response regulator transcription factor [Steroidobacteraceae bacterium]
SASGLDARVEVDSPAALEDALADLSAPIVVTGVRWTETAPFLDRATAHDVPVALLLEEELLDARHAGFRRGAAALLPWPVATGTLASALEAIRHGLRLVPRLPGPSSSTARTAASLKPAALAPLSTRERELMELVAAGLSNKAMARALGVSINTVKYHLASAFTKLDARTRAEAVSAAARRGDLML